MIYPPIPDEILAERDDEKASERISRVVAYRDMSRAEAFQVLKEYDARQKAKERALVKMKLGQDIKADQYLDRRLKLYLERIVELL